MEFERNREENNEEEKKKKEIKYGKKN